MIDKIKKVYFNIFKAKYECPFCGHKVIAFEKHGQKSEIYNHHEMVGAGYRDNCLCFKCGSTDRERLLYSVIKFHIGLLNIKQKYNILHVAPEKNISKLIEEKSFHNYIKGDKFTKGYSYSAGTIDLDITNLNFENNYFDIIICNHVLEHVPNEKLALTELHRVLKTNGKAIMQVPFSMSIDKTIEMENVLTDADRISLYGQFDHVRLYGRDYVERFKEVGFVIDQIIDPKSQKWFKINNKIGVNLNELLTIYTKK